MTLDEVRQLQQKKFRDAAGCFVVEGEHLIIELQKALTRQPALADARLFVTPLHADWQSPFLTQVISERQMAKIADTQNPQGMLAVVPHWPAPAPRPGERAIYLHEIQDPGNLGTIIRVADAAGADAIIITGRSVDLYNPKVVRSTTGSLFHVPIAVDVELDDVLVRARAAGLNILAADVKGDDLPGVAADGTLTKPTAWLFGNEARGLTDEHLALADAAVRVPIYGDAS